MVDGPVANLPPGMDAYAGYVNDSGIGITYPGAVALAKQQNAIPFSFTTNGAWAQCADVESGAMSNWSGYSYGYCSVSRVNGLIALYGRPHKLLTAHQDPTIGKHICSPACWPGLSTTADGTQWIDHDNLYDESVLADDFFQLTPTPNPTPLPPFPPSPIEQEIEMERYQDGGQDHIVVYQPARNRTVHYWQFTPGTPAAQKDPQWRSEVLPEPA